MLQNLESTRSDADPRSHSCARGARAPSRIWALALTILATLPTLAAPRASAQSVNDVLATHSGDCTTAGVEGLAEQLVRTHLCMYPGAVTTFTPYPNITLGSSRVHPLAAVETRDALHAAADRGPLQVSSAFRTLVEQYLLYREGGCGLAARPGASNHQSGVAVDLSNWSAALSRMTGAGCRHPYPTDDPVHFDCPGPDMRSASVLVFQHLWNANHPEDPIAEDGAYGPQTEARLGRSPARGFASDGCTVAPPVQWGAEFVAQSFPLAREAPIVMHPGDEVSGYIELRNVGTEAWTSSTRLATTGPRDRESALAGPDWMAANRPAWVDGTVEPDGTWRFMFTLRAPDALGDYDEHFGVVQEGTAWFSDPGQLGPPDDQLEIRVSVVAPEVVDAGTVDPVADAGVDPVDAEVVVRGDAGPRPHDGGLGGSCSCRAAGSGRSAPGIVALLAALGVAIARRRRA